jgi:hypothetical protein
VEEETGLARVLTRIQDESETLLVLTEPRLLVMLKNGAWVSCRVKKNGMIVFRIGLRNWVYEERKWDQAYLDVETAIRQVIALEKAGGPC